ncbi:MAG: hypothetical protein ACRDLV_14140, partial [Solirubrobacteraceae bacterium]
MAEALDMRRLVCALSACAVVVALLGVLSVGVSQATVLVTDDSGAGASCSCAKAVGAFVNPASGSVISGQQTSAGSYTAAWNSLNGTVTVKKSGATVLTVDGTVGGFGPNQKAFVAETDNGGITEVNVYNLTSASPATSVFVTGPTVISDQLKFSPSGHYFLDSWTTSGGITHFELADATATSAKPALWTQQVTSSAPPGQGGQSFGTVTDGWGPDDTKFVYGATEPNGEVSWYWTDLSAAAPETYDDLNLAVNSSYVQFSPCGNYVAIVASSGTDTVDVGLWDLATGAQAGTTGVLDGAGQAITLKATAASYVATVDGSDHTLAANDCTVTTGGGGGSSGPHPTGAFVNPAKSAVPSGSTGNWTVTWNDDETVTVADAGVTVLHVQGVDGGLGPGQKAFVAEDSQGVYLYNLTSTTPAAAVFVTGATATSSRVGFSPKGHYCLYSYTTADGTTHFQAADATSTANSPQPAVWTQQVVSAAPSGDGADSFGNVYFG